MCKAKELRAGDILEFAFVGTVVAADPVAAGKRIKIKIALDDQKRLEFLAAGVLEFLCPPSRPFHPKRDGDDWGDEDDEIEPGPAPVGDLVA